MSDDSIQLQLSFSVLREISNERTECAWRLRAEVIPTRSFGYWLSRLPVCAQSSAPLYSTNPWPDIRYAEVLLNYAEAVAESGQGDAALAKKCLNDIRHRAAFKDDIDLTVDNVLHERRVELAFEDDLSFTLHRRREFAFGASNAQRKRALVPMVDLRGSEPKYILVRANVYHGDVSFNRNGLFISDYRSYYGAIPNQAKNQIEKNPIQE